ncbi:MULTISPECIES: CorA family divalent cation transporter [Extibacter]|uniref:magnesium transporter CorA family protein n=1 Tax=Extibacter TaxID=1918452 RepID=UPI001AA1553F|nr:MULTISPECIES: CorA family divalent cation transporter [Extibacter]BDF34183.1 magnesium transporter [Lachnospiraceae bacterium]MBO1719143.1 magnesium and cobalt transporter CorA [Extibacter sp. GGCC_0201]MCB6200428.1 magnesium and cobalt transporter CorA [Extibacter muris]MCQ4663461.1 magnesium and cobalt transporter CorA [Extibacter muris]MCQ4692885.1 magnesium and cobalt transporter CorA [Extibacter muris]
MRYRLNGSIEPIGGDEEIGDDESLVEIITSEQYEDGYKKHFQKKMLLNIYHTHYCRADLLKDCVIGTFVIPRKDDLLGTYTTFGFYMTTEKLVLVDDSGIIEKLVKHMAEALTVEKTYTAHFFFELMEYLVKEDVIFLQNYEKKLSELEGVLLQGVINDFDKKMLAIRKELLALQSYYQQLTDVSETLEENQNHMFEEEDCRIFDLYSKRADRLFDNTRRLQEYSLQLREMYESQIDIRQNKIMKFLTVVTTIFLPLSLIAGWYGMNFVGMPELSSPYGYAVVIIVSIAIILVEIWLFRIKKWFD